MRPDVIDLEPPSVQAQEHVGCEEGDALVPVHERVVDEERLEERLARFHGRETPLRVGSFLRSSSPVRRSPALASGGRRPLGEVITSTIEAATQWLGHESFSDDVAVMGFELEDESLHPLINR